MKPYIEIRLEYDPAPEDYPEWMILANLRENGVIR